MLPDTFFQGGKISARKIGAADRAGEQAIADDGATWSGTTRRGRKDKHDLPRGVARNVPHLDHPTGESQGGPSGKVGLAAGNGAWRKTIPGLYGGHFTNERQVAFVAAQGQVVDFLDVGRGRDVIEVSMGGQQSYQDATGRLDGRQESGGFFTRIDQERLVSVRAFSRQ